MLSEGIVIPMICYENTQAVLFDLDGTLLDTANDLGEALNYILAKYSLPLVKRETYRPVASDGALGLLNLGFKEKLVDYDYEKLRNEFLDYYENNIAIHTKLYSGITELLNILNAKNIPWGVVTNKPEGLTKQLLPYFSEFEHCGVLVGGDTLSTRKPDPEPLLYACEQMNVDPKHCLYIGDALRDIEAGNNAEMTTYVAQWGYIKSTDNTQQWLANFIIQSPQELFSIT